MRIGIFTDTYTPYISGVVTSITVLKKTLEDMGHEVFVVTINMDKSRYSYDEKDKVLRVPGINAKIYDDVKISGIYPIHAIEKIKKWKLDVIHSHTEFSIGTFARIISKQYNIPIVHTYHTMYEDYIYLVTKGKFERPAKKLVEYFTKFYCDKTVSELIVPTKKAYDLFKNKYKLNRNIHIIPTGTDIKKFSKVNEKELKELKRKLNINQKDFVVLVISRLSKEKNIDFIIDAHKKINKQNDNIKLIIIGDGPHSEELKKKAKRIKNIDFLGKVPYEKIPLYYKMGSIFVTSSKTETQGLTVNEALAASLPVLCIEDDSFKLSVIDKFNGFFFNNKKEYTKFLIDLYSDENLYKNISRQALSSSLKFSTKHFGESILEVYKMATKNTKVSIIQKIKNIIKGK